MKNNTFQSNSIWNDAARSGIVLGLVSVAYMVCSNLLAKINASGVGAAALNVGSLILWGFKFYLCIHLMKVFMQRYADTHEDVTNGDTFRFGALTALLSALIYSGLALAWSLFVQPEALGDAMQTVLAASSDALNETQISAVEELIPKLPSITFFLNFSWCWLFGTVLSAILSANIPSKNPFKNMSGPDDQ